MKAKLINRWGDYRLYVNETPYATTGDSPYAKLSLSNCQAIERGYDLYELAREMTDKEHQLATQYSKGYEKGIVIGFQKALELMGDKKFSEEDIHEAYSLGEREDRSGFHGLLNSKQQTEWDVEIEMDAIPADRAPGGWDRFPKLDADGCLILKPLPKE